MSKQELKDILTQRIISINDEEVLNAIKLITDDAIKTYNLDSEEKSRLNEALEDYKEGRVVSHEQAVHEIDSWLSEK